MTLLIDPPTWPAHGTMWSHLISDRSLDELHAFAAGLDLPRRSFDLDHYDVPASRRLDALAAGADPAGGRELLRRLVASGLRVPGRDRPTLQALRRRWLEQFPEMPEVGDGLLVRWREPHRVYHGPRHLTETLDAADLLLMADRGPRPVSSRGDALHRDGNQRLATLALWFHDAVHAGVAGQDERDSAALAMRELVDLPPIGAKPRPLSAEVAKLVLVTTDHVAEPGDSVAAVVADADLAILGAGPARYAEYTRQVRAEYAHVPGPDFRAARAAILNQLLTRKNLYHTTYARALWQRHAVANLRAELATPW